MLKQTPKARNQLKRVTKINYKPDEGDEFERSWLLLADIHIQVRGRGKAAERHHMKEIACLLYPTPLATSLGYPECLAQNIPGQHPLLVLTPVRPCSLQGGKFDLAQDLCQKCLKYNKSCAKAWEMTGAIMEREQSYKDAAEHYEKAWKHENQASAQVCWAAAMWERRDKWE